MLEGWFESWWRRGVGRGGWWVRGFCLEERPMEFEVVEKGRGEGDGREGREEGREEGRKEVRGKAGCDFLR